MGRPRVDPYPAPQIPKAYSITLEREEAEKLERYVEAERERIGYHEVSMNRMIGRAVRNLVRSLEKGGKIPDAPEEKPTPARRRKKDGLH